MLRILPAVARARAALLGKRCDPRLAVFVSDYPRAREAKLAYGLRSAGWNVVLLYTNEPNFDVARYFDEVRCYKDAWQALSFATNYAPRVYHVFSLMADDTAAAFVRHKPGKVIFDTNDMTEGMIKDNFGRIPLQRYCIENADGLCCRDLQVQYVTRAFGYKRPTKVVFFPEYCWDLPENSEPVDHQDSDEIHVVLCGNLGIEKRGEAEWGYLDIAEQFAAQGVHFHIYPHWFWFSVPTSRFEEIFSDYIALSQRTPFFHLHRSVSMDAVIPELRKYDVGIAITRAITYGENLTKHTSAHLHHCGSGRIFDYLDAGLPVIVNRSHRLQYCMLSRYGLAIDGTREMLENAKDHLRKVLSPDLMDKLSQARSTYSVRRQIGRLISLYESL